MRDNPLPSAYNEGGVLLSHSARLGWQASTLCMKSVKWVSGYHRFLRDLRQRCHVSLIQRQVAEVLRNGSKKDETSASLRETFIADNAVKTRTEQSKGMWTKE